MIEERDPDPRDERVRQLEAEMAELRSAMRRLTDSANGSHAPADASTSTRRGLLRLAGAAAIGAVGASMASSSPAAANNGIEPNNQDSQTIVTYTGAATVGNGISFISYPGGGNVTVGSAESRAAVAAWTAAPSGLRNGLHGWTNISTGAGVVAEHGAIAGTALKAIALPESGLGISASGQTAVAANGGQIAFQAAGPIGFYSAGNTRCAMWISPNAGGAPRTVPSTRTDAHQAGEIDFAAGSLWLCTASGTPGTWVSLGGASTGGFHPITPSRVYDSRGTGGPLAAGASRAVSVANAIDPASLQVSTPDIVPSGATAITANVTVVNTVAAGFLAANPAGDTTVHAATVNWFASGQILNNGVTMTLGGDRSLNVIAGGSGGAQTDFVIDVTGWF